MVAFKALFALAAYASTASAAFNQGFNYGSTKSDGSAMMQADFQEQFAAAKKLQGNSGFTSARLYTMIQDGTTNGPIEAIPAAIATQTTLLLGLWGSGGQTGIDNELAALASAISLHGTQFTDLIVGISVGSEDLYRNSPIGIENKSGIGASPEEIASYITQTRNAISKTTASGAPIGHVDTYTAWINSSNDAVISAVDWLGTDAYPYFQSTEANSIANAPSEFQSALDQTKAVSQGKAVWVTETGYPVSGPVSGLAIASVANAKTYWDAVACDILGAMNVYWYTLYDEGSSPSFGLVNSPTSSTPLYDLSCSAKKNTTSTSSASASASASASKSASSSKAVETSHSSSRPHVIGISTKNGTVSITSSASAVSTIMTVPSGTGSSVPTSLPGGVANATTSVTTPTVTPLTGGATSWSRVGGLMGLVVASTFFLTM